MVPTREDLEKIAIELFLLDRGGDFHAVNELHAQYVRSPFPEKHPGHWEVYIETKIENLQWPQRTSLAYVKAGGVNEVWFSRQGVKNLEDRVKILESMVAALAGEIEKVMR